MMNVQIRIELNALDKAKVEVEALLVTIDALSKTYETTFKEPAPEPTPVKKAKKAPVKKPEPAPVKKPEPTPEPTPEPKPATVTLPKLTDLAKKAVAAKGRDVVKKAIADYGTGKLSSVPEENWEALEAELNGMIV